MKRLAIRTIPFFFLMVTAAPLLAQNPPPPPGGPGQDQGQDNNGGPPPRDGRRMGNPNDDGGPPPEMRQASNMLHVVDGFAHLAHDPAGAGIAAVIGANDMMRPKGLQADIDFFTKLLPNVKNQAVARAIHLTLIDLYRKNNQPDKALDEMTLLITTAPAEEAPVHSLDAQH